MSKDLSKDQWVKKGVEMSNDRIERILTAKKRKFDTVATHGIYDLKQALENNNGSIMEPVYMSPAQAFISSAEMEAALAYEMPSWTYSRIANPSSYFLEETAALLETYGSDMIASCLSTGSGMSAVRTATDPFLVTDPRFPMPNIVTTAKVYGGTFQQFSIRRSKEQGVEIRWVCNPFDLDEWKSKIDDNTRFLYGEFPSNPAVAIFDIEEVAKLAHAYEIPLIVDSTCASPALTRPLLLGADIVIHSASKVISASGTSIVGLMIAKQNITSKLLSPEIKSDFATWAKLWPFRDNGPAISPMSAILTLNDMRSLRSRVEQMSRTAMIVARWLEKHPAIDRVHYPGLESYPAHEIAKKYMKLVDSGENLFGFMLAFEVKENSPAASRNVRLFYDGLNMIWRATDLGRVKSVATLNAISTHQQQGEEGRKLADIKPNTCRLSVGIEHPDDIISDLDNALQKIV